MSFIWSRTDGASGPSISIVFDNGDVVTVGKDHASLTAITKKLAAEAPEEELRELLQPVKAITIRLQRLSERVTTDGANLFFDGDALHDTLADYILSLIRLEAEQGEAPSWKPFVNFLEKNATNPNPQSRDSLYTFIQKHGLTIRPNGDFIAYKGIRTDFGSVRSGPGTVDNVEYNGHLPNKPGSIVELKRSLIDANTGNGCAVGLHAGTIEFAKGWGPLVVAVAINPRDVVAVPFDGSFHKIRAARYEVLTVISKPEKAQATVGDKSAPVYTGPTTPLKVAAAVDEEIVKKLNKAIKKGRTLEVEYISRAGRPGKKTYVIKPVSIDGLTVKLELPGEENAIRTFRIDRIQSVKKLDN